MWRSKSMAVADLSAFGTRFRAEFQKLGEPPEMAAFARVGVEGQSDTVLVSPGAAEAAEGISPGEWERVAKPSALRMRLIGGRSDALLWFRLGY
jgi:hypothetical protein